MQNSANSNIYTLYPIEFDGFKIHNDKGDIDMTINDIITKLDNVGYCPTTEIAYGVMAAVACNRPLLVEGAPGAGKTALAKAIADMLNLPLVRVQFYEGITSDDILYDYDYQKQLLTLEAIKPSIVKELKNKSIQDSINYVSNNTSFYGKNFLIERPIMQAINGQGRKVLLLDEIDKASEEVEYMLLEVLSEYSISVPQYGTITCPKDQKPIVVLTSNGYRELSDALKRRCAYLYINNKSKEEMLHILKNKTKLDDKLANSIAECMVKIQNASLKQTPSIAEAIDWGTYLQMQFGPHLENLSNPNDINYTLGSIAKNKEDETLLKNIHLEQLF